MKTLSQDELPIFCVLLGPMGVCKNCAKGLRGSQAGPGGRKWPYGGVRMAMGDHPVRSPRTFCKTYLRVGLGIGPAPNWAVLFSGILVLGGERDNLGQATAPSQGWEDYSSSPWRPIYKMQNPLANRKRGPVLEECPVSADQ
jgi:hypothetical protein